MGGGGGGGGGQGKFSVSFEEIFSSQEVHQYDDTPMIISVLYGKKKESCCFERNNIDCPSCIPDLLQSEL